MDRVSEEDLVVSRGRSRTVAYARDASGQTHAREFLRACGDPLTRARLLLLFEFLAEDGRIAGKRKFRKERGDIWGFKSGDARIAALHYGRVWYLAHGFIKRRDRWPPAELDRAERIRWEHLKRGLRGRGDE